MSSTIMTFFFRATVLINPSGRGSANRCAHLARLSPVALPLLPHRPALLEGPGWRSNSGKYALVHPVLLPGVELAISNLHYRQVHPQDFLKRIRPGSCQDPG